MRKTSADRLLLLSLLVLAGNNPVYNALYIIPTSVAAFVWIFLIAFFYLLYRKPFPLRISIAIYMVAGVALLLSQSMVVDQIAIGRVVRFFAVALIPFGILGFINSESLRYIPLLMVRIVQLSLLIWIPAVVLDLAGLKITDFMPQGILFHDIPGSDLVPTHALLHNFRGLEQGAYFMHRNSGMYWEPGAFAGVILMTYVLYILRASTYPRHERIRIHVWLGLGLISTLSTAGLIVMPVAFLIASYRRNRGNRRVLRWLGISVPATAVAAFVMFQTLPVVSEKVQFQWQLVQLDVVGSHSTRLGSMLFLSDMIKESPMLGHSVIAATDIFSELLYSRGYNSDRAIGNGMFLYVAQAGIPFFVLLVLLWYRSFRRMARNRSLAIVLTAFMLLLLQGQSWMHYPLIYTFMFIGDLMGSEGRVSDHLSTSHQNVMHSDMESAGSAQGGLSYRYGNMSAISERPA